MSKFPVFIASNHAITYSTTLMLNDNATDPPRADADKFGGVNFVAPMCVYHKSRQYAVNFVRSELRQKPSSNRLILIFASINNKALFPYFLSLFCGYTASQIWNCGLCLLLLLLSPPIFALHTRDTHTFPPPLSRPPGCCCSVRSSTSKIKLLFSYCTHTQNTGGRGQKFYCCKGQDSQLFHQRILRETGPTAFSSD